MNARAAAVAELERRLGYTFGDRDLLERALTHASAGDGAPSTRSNERLEFLGDRVLNLIVAEELMRRMPDVDEGLLTKAFHKLVNVEACAAAAAPLGLGEALRFGGGAGKLGMRRNLRVLGDACEALIAALYLEAGLQATRDCVLRLWTDHFDNLDAPGAREAKTELNEWALARGLPAPIYKVVRQDGPAHAPRFEIEVFVQGYEPEIGEGGSKKEAEKQVAAKLLRRLGEPT
jgi:ribonuclease-3